METRPQDTDSTRREPLTAQPHHTSSGLDTERLKRTLLAILGGALVVRGLRRRSLVGLAMAFTGGVLFSVATGADDRVEEALESRSGSGDDSQSRSDGDDARGGSGDDESSTVSRSIVVGRPADELFDLWRDPEQLSRFVGHFADVSETDDDRLRWTVHGPRGRDFSWETEVVEETPGEELRWETAGDARLLSEGSVRFAPAAGDRGTVVTLSVDFDPPGGRAGNAALERLDAAPEMLVGTALDRFKSLAETGEIQTQEANPSARGKGDLV